jgi:predicted secreted acid phosphatase
MTDRLAGRVKTQSKSRYYAGWPNKCEYNTDLNWACSVAIQYLKKIAPKYKENGKTGIVIFDLDDTLFFGDPDNSVGVTEMSLGIHKDQEVFILPINEQVVKVAVTARKLGFKILCLTARPQESQMASVANLKMFRIPHDMLVMNDKDEDPFFKIKIRRQLVKPKQDVVLTMGDQFTDIFLPGPNTAAIKLPDPDSQCSYAYIP